MESMGVAIAGVVVRRYIDFLIIYLSLFLLLSVLFPILFVHLKSFFSSCSCTFL